MVESLNGDVPLVLLGTPNADSTRLYALTVTEGDPTWAGALAESHLHLPVYHITEPEIKAQVDPLVYEAQVGLTEMVLDVSEIAQVLTEVREAERVGP